MALVKYWGKRDSALMLPLTGSFSLTIDSFPTTTTVTPAVVDSFTLNGTPLYGDELQRVVRFLDLARALTGTSDRVAVTSTNSVPTAAGLASSAAGFAALALAASAAFGLSREPRDVSRLARRGSGSATRSVLPGYAVWHAGDDEHSFAEAVDGPEIRLVVVLLSKGAKPVSSREAMRRTIDTSPFLDGWVSSTELTLTEMLAAAAARDFTRMGELTELHALRLHALIQSAQPPIRYLAPASIAVFDEIARMRTAGIEVYGTADAGPNVVAMCRPADAETVAAALSNLGPTQIVGPGPGATLLADQEQ